MEDFCIFCPILEVSMLDRRVSGKLSGIAITVGELPTHEQGDEGMWDLIITVCLAFSFVFVGNLQKAPDIWGVGSRSVEFLRR